MAVHAESNIQLNTIPAQTSLLGGHFVYFQGNTGSGGHTPASANVIADSRYLSIPAQWGYNTHIGANGIKLRYNETTLSEWTADHLTFYKPGTNNPSLELINGINTALNIYNPTNNTKTLGLDTSGLNFYGTSTSTPDVTLNADGLTLINGSIRGGIVGQDEFLYLSPQVFSDEYEEYVLSTDTTVDETKTYYTRSGEEGEYVYTEVSEPTGSPQENEYYEIAHAPGTIPIDNYVKSNWRQIIGRNFAVDTDGNLYANGLNAKNANIEGEITATSFTIGNGSDAYNGEAAINVSGYDIIIYEDSTDSSIIDHENTTYLYPVMYHNGEIDNTVDNTHYIWFMDNIEPGTTGDAVKGGIIASYGHSYRVTYDFDDSAVGTGTLVQERIVDPSKYITKISDTGITIHPEFNTNTTSIQLDGTGLDIIKSGVSVAKYSTTARIGQENSSRFLINSNSLQAYNFLNQKYFEVNENGLAWGNNTAATTNYVNNSLSNYLTDITGGGVYVHAIDTPSSSTSSTAKGVKITDQIDIIRNGDAVAKFGSNVTIGKDDNTQSYIYLDYHSLQMIDKEGEPYFYVSDLRNNAGIATLTDVFQGDGTTTTFNLSIGYHGTNTVTNVTINNTQTSAYTTTNSSITFNSAPQNYAKIVVTYTATYYKTKAYTFGNRQNGTLGAMSVAEGENTLSSGFAAHAEGCESKAIGWASHAEGGSIASGAAAHSEGWGEAIGRASHAEGGGTASGEYAHAEGFFTEATGYASHAGGANTVAQRYAQTVIGEYNIADTYRDPNASSSLSDENVRGKYAFIVGNGQEETITVGDITYTESIDYSNAFTVDWSGNIQYAGSSTKMSDKRLKKHKSYLSADAIKFIQKLKPAYFEKDNQLHTGFYAQDVEEIDPWNCMTGEMNGYKTLGYDEIIAPLVAYCQHLEERIKQLEEIN